MRIDNLDVCVADELLVERVENELIILNKNTEQIISMNEIATVIWEKICKAKEEDNEFTICDISKYIMNLCQLDNERYFEIQRDINECLNQFRIAGLLVL